MRRRAWRGWICLIFVVLRFFGKGFRVELPREVFYGGNEARSGTVDSIADRDVTTIAHSIEKTPAGKIGKSLSAMRGSTEMRLHKNQKFRLKTDNFLKVDLGPIARGIDDRDGAGVTQRICDECVFADRDEGLGPNDEENAARRHGSKPLVEGR